jgi:D-alanyl-D-alanine carboxypeptidase
MWADATGVVDLRSKRPANNGSLFILNSATKTIVATMVMQAIQRSQLSLGTRLSRFYPWLPNAREISVRMLLNMTGGLPDYLCNRRIGWMIQHRPRHHWTEDQVLTGLGTGLATVTFPPGREYQYSDTDYVVLGRILERIAHSLIERDFQQLIARPLGLTSATFVATPAASATPAGSQRQSYVAKAITSRSASAQVCAIVLPRWVPTATQFAEAAHDTSVKSILGRRGARRPRAIAPARSGQDAFKECPRPQGDSTCLIPL